jgi:hypothetical protein
MERDHNIMYHDRKIRWNQSRHNNNIAVNRDRSSIGSYLQEQKQVVLDQLKQPQQRRSLPTSESFAVLMGIVTFGSTLAISTITQGKLLHISTGTSGPIPSLIGFTTVCLASVASHNVALYTKHHCHEYFRLNHKYPTILSTIQHDVQQIAIDLQVFRHKLRKDVRNVLFGNNPTEYLDLKGLQVPIHTIRM